MHHCQACESLSVRLCNGEFALLDSVKIVRIQVGDWAIVLECVKEFLASFDSIIECFNFLFTHIKFELRLLLLDSFVVFGLFRITLVLIEGVSNFFVLVGYLVTFFFSGGLLILGSESFDF